jgi:hypothetical protein
VPAAHEADKPNNIRDACASLVSNDVVYIHFLQQHLLPGLESPPTSPFWRKGSCGQWKMEDWIGFVLAPGRQVKGICLVCMIWDFTKCIPSHAKIDLLLLVRACSVGPMALNYGT